FGGLSVVNLILSFIPVVNVLVFLISIVIFIYWVIFMVKALQGNGERIPAPVIGTYINTYVDQLANSVK
ncbi:MAG TPA: hypothetical protein VGR34_03555, partial [Candidatus Dormibacteraeota bacterium]|nr:hypothetical protein [Candidatus Dormibacteraeota bacterium]